MKQTFLARTRKKRWKYTAPFRMCTRGQKKCGKMKISNTTTTIAITYLPLPWLLSSPSPHIAKVNIACKWQHNRLFVMHYLKFYEPNMSVCVCMYGGGGRRKRFPKVTCVYKKRNMPLNIAHIKPIKSRSWDKHILVSSDLGSLLFTPTPTHSLSHAFSLFLVC